MSSPNIRVVSDHETEFRESEFGGKQGRQMPVLKKLEEHLHTQMQLCDELEKIADDLPENVNSQQCLQLARCIFPTIKKAHEFEEGVLFPVLLKNGTDIGLYNTVQRLHAEHWEDEGYAHEVQDALIDFVANPEDSNPEAIGYMLRGFFEGLRRHIAFEKDHVAPEITKMMQHTGN